MNTEKFAFRIFRPTKKLRKVDDARHIRFRKTYAKRLRNVKIHHNASHENCVK